jgi:hypothetical protein
MRTERRLGSIIVDGESIDLIETSYADGRTAVLARDAEGRPYGQLSVNPGEGATLSPDTIAVKTWSENASWWEIAVASGLFSPIGVALPLGGGNAPLWRIRKAN